MTTTVLDRPPSPRVHCERILKSSFDNYTRLAKGLFGMSSLWLGQDHLVYAKGRGFLLPFSEEYRRYRYGDIQAFSLVKTSRLALGLLYSFGLSLVVGVLVLLAIFGRGDSFGPAIAVTAIVFSLVGLTLLALLLRHLILGPTCLCDIQTSLSQERIRPLARYHRARQIIDEIGVKIDRAQSGLVDSGGTAGTALASTAVSERYSIPRSALPTFAFTALAGGACIASLHLGSIAVAGISLLLLFAVSVLLLVALVHVVRRATPRAIRTTLWSSLGILFLLLGTGVIYYMIAATLNPAYTLGIEGPLRAFSNITRGEWLVFYLLFISLGLGLFLAGSVGVIAAIRWNRKFRAKNTLPDVTEVDENE